MKMKTILTAEGSDCRGGDGIQANIKKGQFTEVYVL